MNLHMYGLVKTRISNVTHMQDCTLTLVSLS